MDKKIKIEGRKIIDIVRVKTFLSKDKIILSLERKSKSMEKGFDFKLEQSVGLSVEEAEELIKILQEGVLLQKYRPF